MGGGARGGGGGGTKKRGGGGGEKKLRGPNLDKLFALTTAQLTLETELNLKPAGVAAVVFKPLSAGEFARAEQEIARACP